MRYIKVLGLIALFVFTMAFLMMNYPVLSQDLTLSLKAFNWEYTTTAFPLYLLMLIAFLVGSLLSMLYFFIERLRLAKQCKVYRKEMQDMEQRYERRIDSLEEELQTLRQLPEESAVPVPPVPNSSQQPMQE